MDARRLQPMNYEANYDQATAEPKGAANKYLPFGALV